MNDNIIEIRNLNIGFQKNTQTISLGTLSFALVPGELNMIIGPNGVGKSTLLKTLVKIIPPLSGDIFIYYQNIKDISRNKLSRLIAYVPTETFIPFHFKVEFRHLYFC